MKLHLATTTITLSPPQYAGLVALLAVDQYDLTRRVRLSDRTDVTRPWCLLVNSRVAMALQKVGLATTYLHGEHYESYACHTVVAEDALKCAYRTAGEPGPATDGALPIQAHCPKCQKSTGRAFFHVVYHADTDRLHVTCGERVGEQPLICGCGAEWIELPGDAR